MAQDGYDQFLRVTNSRAYPVLFRLEPWAEEYDMPSGATYFVAARGPAHDCLTIDFGDRDIEVWAWHGARVWLFTDGTELGRGRSTRMPEYVEPPRLASPAVER